MRHCIIRHAIRLINNSLPYCTLIRLSAASPAAAPEQEDESIREVVGRSADERSGRRVVGHTVALSGCLLRVKSLATATPAAQRALGARLLAQLCSLGLLHQPSIRVVAARGHAVSRRCFNRPASARAAPVAPAWRATQLAELGGQVQGAPREREISKFLLSRRVQPLLLRL